MKLKEVVLTSIFVAALISQNYLLFSIPFTLTYVIFYLISKTITNKTLVNSSVFLFVLVKNIIMPAFPFTIFFDLVGLLLFVNICAIKKIRFKHIIITTTIIIHIILLDLSLALMTDNILVGLIGMISSSFITYIYAPFSIVLILIVDGIDVITDYNEEKK